MYVGLFYLVLHRLLKVRVLLFGERKKTKQKGSNWDFGKDEEI